MKVTAKVAGSVQRREVPVPVGFVVAVILSAEANILKFAGKGVPVQVESPVAMAAKAPVAEKEDTEDTREAQVPRLRKSALLISDEWEEKRRCFKRT